MASTYVFKTLGVIPGSLPGIFDRFLARCEWIDSSVDAEEYVMQSVSIYA